MIKKIKYLIKKNEGARLKIRAVCSDESEYSKELQTNDSLLKFIKNSKLVDGVAVVTKYTEVEFNCRHNLF